MESVELMAISGDPLLACCQCSRLLQEAVQLKCLHNCCWRCFAAGKLQDGSSGLVCSKCGTITQPGSEQRNFFMDNQVKSYTSFAESWICAICKDNGEHDKPALFWCSTCQQSFCGDCSVGHGQYFRQHVTQSLEEVKSLDEVTWTPSSSSCPIHMKPQDIACISCEQVMCINCYVDCYAKKHTMHVVGEDSFNSHVSNLVASISTMKSKLFQKSNILAKTIKGMQVTEAARRRHLKELDNRRRRILDAVDKVFREIEFETKNAHDDVEWNVGAAATEMAGISSNLSDAQNYVCRLIESSNNFEIFKQHKNLQERLGVLSTNMDSFSDRLSTTIGEVIFDSTLPDDLENVIGECFGTPITVYPALSSAKCFSFGAPTVNIGLPMQCYDFALMKDGRLLLAAVTDGLIEFCFSSKREISRWLPPKFGSEQGEKVHTVAALSDGRAVVSLHHARLLVLLRRSTKNDIPIGGTAAAEERWIEDRRLDPLPWSPQLLSVHGDVLAVSEFFGGRLQLMSLRSGRRRGVELRREYVISSLAVAPRVVVTGSLSKVKHGSGPGSGYLIDAHSLFDNGRHDRLWRYDLSSSDECDVLQGMCADSSGGCLYFTAWSSDRSSGRVSALSLADGSELRRVVLSYQFVVPQLLPPLLPVRLSLCDLESSSNGRAMLLAALCWDRKSNAWRTVTVHHSIGDGQK